MEEKGKKEEEKFSLIDWCEKHLALLTAVTSILGIGLTGFFKLASYWYEKGYYDFWGIPIKYMEINYDNILMQFLFSFSGIVITCAVGIVYIEIYNSSRLRGKVFLHILLLFINTGIIIYATYSVGGTVSDVFDFANDEVRRAFIAAEIFLYVMEVISIFFFNKMKNQEEKVKKEKPKKEKMQKNKNSKQKIEGNNQSQKNIIMKSSSSKGNDEKDDKATEVDQYEETLKTEGEKKKPLIKKATAFFVLILVVIAIGAIDWICYNLYKERKDKCEDTNKFEVMSDDTGQEYVILTTYDDKYFVKPCIASEEKHLVAINSDKYKLIQMGDNEVTIYDFSEFKEAFKPLSNDEFTEQVKIFGKTRSNK